MKRTGKKVSVIVPVYDCEKYLDGCIRSILAQTYDNLEVLLIDDGATDDSGTVCERYQGDERVRVWHRENSGVSATRNFGIAEATGEYLVFVDSDDTIEPDMVSSLVNNIEKNQADCAVCGMIYDYADGHSRNYPEEPVCFETDGRGAIREILLDRITMAGPVCKIFRRESVPANVFPADITLAEDAIAMITILMKMQTVIFDMKPFYHYNRREGSLTTSSYSKRDFDVIIAYERIAELLRDFHLEREVEFRQIVAHFRVYDKFVRDCGVGKGKKEEQYRWFAEHFSDILRNPYVGRNRKIATFFLRIHPALYQKIIVVRS